MKTLGRHPAEIMLENIITATAGHTFSKDVAAAIVGGRKKLEGLIAAGKIEAFKGTCAQNSKWKCNAAQVLLHCRSYQK